MGPEAETLDNPILSTQYEAGKALNLRGKQYNRGDIVDTSGLDQFKIGQLLRQRYLQPASPKPPVEPLPDPE